MQPSICSNGPQMVILHGFANNPAAIKYRSFCMRNSLESAQSHQVFHSLHRLEPLGGRVCSGSGGRDLSAEPLLNEPPMEDTSQPLASRTKPVEVSRSSRRQRQPRCSSPSIRRAGFRHASPTAVPGGAPVNSRRVFRRLYPSSARSPRATHSRGTPHPSPQPKNPPAYSSHPAFPSRTFHPSPAWLAHRLSSSAIKPDHRRSHVPSIADQLGVHIIAVRIVPIIPGSRWSSALMALEQVRPGFDRSRVNRCNRLLRSRIAMPNRDAHSAHAVAPLDQFLPVRRSRATVINRICPRAPLAEMARRSSTSAPEYPHDGG